MQEGDNGQSKLLEAKLPRNITGKGGVNRPAKESAFTGYCDTNCPLIVRVLVHILGF